MIHFSFFIIGYLVQLILLIFISPFAIQGGANLGGRLYDICMFYFILFINVVMTTLYTIFQSIFV